MSRGRRDPEGWLFAALLVGLLLVRLSCGAGESRPVGYEPVPEEQEPEERR